LTRFALPLAAFALLVAGCGGDDEPGRTVTAPATGAVRVVAKEYSFDPATIVMRGPGTLPVRLVNEGSLAHNLKLLEDSEELGGTPSFPSGESRSALLKVESGSYEFICTVGDHAELGMKGTLTVEG
jgi:plastocyanin